MQTVSRRVRLLIWTAVFTAAAAAVVVVAIPTLTIVPFRPQTARTLAVAYPLQRIAPTITLLALAIVVAGGGLLLLRRARTQGRSQGLRTSVRITTVAVLTGLTALMAWFSRQNHFEWMFEPLARVRYVSTQDAARFLTDDEIVIGVDLNQVSVAYPIRQMAYHHVVNAMFGTTPVVVTY
jgi:Protein of unknown function (DUF3179)